MALFIFCIFFFSFFIFFLSFFSFFPFFSLENLNRTTTIQAVDCCGQQTSHLQHHHTQLGWADCYGANTLQTVDDTSGRLLRTADKSPSTPPYAAWLGGLPRRQHTAERQREAGRNLNYIVGNKPQNKCLCFNVVTARTRSDCCCSKVLRRHMAHRPSTSFMSVIYNLAKWLFLYSVYFSSLFFHFFSFFLFFLFLFFFFGPQAFFFFLSFFSHVYNRAIYNGSNN